MSTTKIDLIDENGEEVPSVSPFVAPVIVTARHRRNAFAELVEDQQARRPVAILMRRVLDTMDHNEVADIISARGPSFSLRRVGDPYPFSRLESFVFARHVDFLLVQKSSATIAEARSRVTSYAAVAASDVACLLDARKWLNDNVIDLFGVLLEDRYDDVAFLPAVVWKGTEAALANYFKPSNAEFIRGKKYFLAPVLSYSHWTFLLFKTKENECMFFNSFHSDWAQFADQAQLRFFGKLSAWLKTFLPVYAGANPIVPKLAREYPTQYDAVSCGVYTMHGMQCIASANHEIQFRLMTWDDMADVLRFDIFMSLVNARIRPLMSSTSFEPVLTDAPSEDLSDEEANIDIQACDQCGNIARCRVCSPWEKVFCSNACHEAYAEGNQLGYL